MGSVMNRMPKRVVARARAKAGSRCEKGRMANPTGYDDGSPQPRSAEAITVSACEDSRRYAGSVTQTCRSSNPPLGVVRRRQRIDDIRDSRISFGEVLWEDVGGVTNQMPKRMVARARAKAGSRC